MAVDQGDLPPAEQAGQAAEQPVDDAGLALVDLRPVGPETSLRHDPEIAGLAHRAGHLGRLEQRLGRDAAAVQAGAAHLMVLHQGNVEPGRGAVQGRRVAAGTAAEHHDVVRAHVVATLRSVLMISGSWGTAASSSGGLVGIGVFLAAMRTTGPSSRQKHSSWTVAAISAP